MLKKITASALSDRLRSLNSSKQALLRRTKQGVFILIAFGGLYVITPPLWNAVVVSPQQRVEPLAKRINDLDKQIKTSPTPSTADLKEIATLEKGRIDTENTIRTSLFQAVGGLLVFVTLYISWRTLQANEAKQVAERFSKAIEQLGSENIHVRLGGIYALEQIAKDAEEKYYWQVMETLTSYVRERSPWNKEKEAQAEQEIPPLPTDIQAVMTVIARRKHSYGHLLERNPLDLSNADLRRLQLPPNTQLNHANFINTNLQSAFLQKVNLQQAIFCNAILQGVFLNKASLQQAILTRANLQEAELESAELQKAILWEADLKEAIFKGANLQKTILDKANLQGVHLKETVGLTREQLNAVASHEGAVLPDYLLTQQPQAEMTSSAIQTTASAQPESET
ncbi:MAG: pentapeptide repeat-containing protein [Stenomitos rutilans HA7619-LM2]|jgi:hypothetical protein|nr:pentapeptide repeat-containing protein [Stenomitos rutilans HA7619-LM2]